MYRKGIRVPATSRIINGSADASWGSEVHGGSPANRLLAIEFPPWGLNISKDYVGKDEQQEPWGNTNRDECDKPGDRAGNQDFRRGVGRRACTWDVRSFISPMGLTRNLRRFPPPSPDLFNGGLGRRDFRIRDGGRSWSSKDAECRAERSSTGAIEEEEESINPRTDGAAISKIPVASKMAKTTGVLDKSHRAKTRKKSSTRHAQASPPHRQGKLATGSGDGGLTSPGRPDGVMAHSYRSMYPERRKMAAQKQCDSTQ